MKYFNTADVKVKLDAPAINVGPRAQHFDIGAQQWPVIHKSPLFDSLLVEEVHDDNGGFAAIFPSKRMATIDNYMDGSPALTCAGSTAKPHITWKPVDSSTITGAFKDMIPDYLPYALADVPVNKTSGVSSAWNGPIWLDNQLIKEPMVDDTKEISGFLRDVGAMTTTFVSPCIVAATAATTSDCAPIATTNWVLQQNVKSGMWWGLTSSPFLTENMPFWVIIKKQMPPTSETHATHLVISFGKNDPENHFDVWLSANMKPRIIDYKMPSGGGSGGGSSGGSSPSGTLPTGMGLEFLSDLSMILATQKEIHVGIMTIAGRLVIYVNGNSYVYTRTKKDSASSAASGVGATSLIECKIASGSIDVCGTNMQTQINVCPMRFAPIGCFVLPVPSFVANVAGSSTTTAPSWKGVKEDGTAGNSVCHIENASASMTYGVDCSVFNGDMGTAAPGSATGSWYHKQGTVSANKAGPGGYTFLSPGLTGVEFYFVVMKTVDVDMGPAPAAGASGGAAPTGRTICNNGTPYYFRLRGIIEPSATSSMTAGTSGGDISDKVISIDENASAPDYFHIRRSLNIVAYDPDMDLAAITGKQTGITLTFQGKKTFTGLVTNVTRSKIAGKETCILTCEDYMHVLKNVPIINSPFYDGMIASAAVKDLAKKAGFNSVAVDWPLFTDAFLPSGYAFSKPAVKYSARQSIFDCIIDIVKRFEAFVYFDGDGKMHVAKLPGGLFSVPSGSTSIAFQSTDPNGLNPIIGEKNISYNFDSTVETISVITVDRDTRNVIFYAQSAGNAFLAYNKTWLYDQGSFGELDAAKAWVNDAAVRMFKPILKCSFKTIGQNAGDVMPFDFITVDGEQFRAMSVKRTFNADNNEVIAAYEGEWKGG